MSSTLDSGVKAGSGLTLKLLLLGFIAGFLATPLGHQIRSLVLYYLVPGRNFPWNMAPNKAAYGLPAIINLSFWGGVWGIIWALVYPYVPKNLGKWAVAFLFGGICATAFGAYVVTALKGAPMGSITWIGLLINGAWGLANAFFYELFRKYC